VNAMANLRRIRDVIEKKGDVCNVINKDDPVDVSLLFNNYIENAQVLAELESNEITRVITVEQYNKMRRDIQSNIENIHKCMVKTDIFNSKKLHALTSDILNQKVIIKGDEKQRKNIFKVISDPSNSIPVTPSTPHASREKQARSVIDENEEISDVDIHIDEGD